MYFKYLVSKTKNEISSDTQYFHTEVFYTWIRMRKQPQLLELKHPYLSQSPNILLTQDNHGCGYDHFTCFPADQMKCNTTGDNDTSVKYCF